MVAKSNYEWKKAWIDRTVTWALDFLGGKCAQCGVTEKLQFDHKDPSQKVIEISVAIKVKCWSRVRLTEELKKCQLLCVPCHVSKSIANNDGMRVPHGGGIAGKRRCKCEPCTVKRREYMRSYNQARRTNQH